MTNQERGYLQGAPWAGPMGGLRLKNGHCHKKFLRYKNIIVYSILLYVHKPFKKCIIRDSFIYTLIFIYLMFIKIIYTQRSDR